MQFSQASVFLTAVDGLCLVFKSSTCEADMVGSYHTNAYVG